MAQKLHQTYSKMWRSYSAKSGAHVGETGFKWTTFTQFETTAAWNWRFDPRHEKKGEMWTPSFKQLRFLPRTLIVCLWHFQVKHPRCFFLLIVRMCITVHSNTTFITWLRSVSSKSQPKDGFMKKPKNVAVMIFKLSFNYFYIIKVVLHCKNKFVLNKIVKIVDCKNKIIYKYKK